MNFDDIYKLYSIEGVLNLGSNKKVIVCPLPQHAHSSNTPSFSIHWYNGRQRFNCFGNCGLNGDVVDLVGYLSFLDYDKSVEMRLKAAERLAGEFEYSPPPKEPVRATLEPWAWKNFIPIGDEARQYAHHRGITDNSIERFRLGQMEEFLTIPSFENDRVTGIKLRRINDYPPRYMSIKGSRRGLFNYDEVFMTEEPVVICKGEIAAIVISQFGIKACAPNSGETSDVGEQVLALSRSRRKILVSDNDADPKTYASIAKYAIKRAVMFDADLYYPPKQYKDLDEYILHDPKAIDVVKGWIDDVS